MSDNSKGIDSLIWALKLIADCLPTLPTEEQWKAAHALLSCLTKTAEIAGGIEPNVITDMELADVLAGVWHEVVDTNGSLGDFLSLDQDEYRRFAFDGELPDGWVRRITDKY